MTDRTRCPVPGCDSSKEERAVCCQECWSAAGREAQHKLLTAGHEADRHFRLHRRRDPAAQAAFTTARRELHEAAARARFGARP